MTEPSRWTVYRYGDFDWHLGIAPGVETVEVMPVSEHEALRDAACLVVDAEYRRERWSVEPDVGRVADGVPRRVDRLRSLGNALVPQIAEWIGRRIMSYEAA